MQPFPVGAGHVNVRGALLAVERLNTTVGGFQRQAQLRWQAGQGLPASLRRHHQLPGGKALPVKAGRKLQQGGIPLIPHGSKDCLHLLAVLPVAVEAGCNLPQTRPSILPCLQNGQAGQWRCWGTHCRDGG